MTARSPRITLYTTRNCPHCRQAKQYLQARGLRFAELDVNHSPRGKKEFARLGARGVPVILVGDRRIDGFDRRRLDAALNKP
jgi:glutaredoxin